MAPSFSYTEISLEDFYINSRKPKNFLSYACDIENIRFYTFDSPIAHSILRKNLFWEVHSFSNFECLEELVDFRLS